VFAAKDTGSGFTTPQRTLPAARGLCVFVERQDCVQGGFGLYQGFLGERRGDAIQPGYTQTTIQTLTTAPTGARCRF